MGLFKKKYKKIETVPVVSQVTEELQPVPQTIPEQPQPTITDFYSKLEEWMKELENYLAKKFFELEKRISKLE